MGSWEMTGLRLAPVALTLLPVYSQARADPGTTTCVQHPPPALRVPGKMAGTGR